MKKLLGFLAVGILITSCSKSDGGDNAATPGNQNAFLGIPGLSAGDGYDNSQGNPVGSIRGTPIFNRTFTLTDDSDCGPGHVTDVNYIFDSQGLLSVVVTVDNETFGSNGVGQDPLAPTQPVSSSNTYVARNVPYSYTVAGRDFGHERRRHDRNVLSSIRIQPIIATTNATALPTQPQFAGNPNWGGQQQTPSVQAIQIGTGMTRRSSSQRHPPLYARELTGNMYDAREFDLMSDIRDDETVVIRHGSLFPGSTFQPNRYSSTIGFCRASLVLNNQSNITLGARQPVQDTRQTLPEPPPAE
jgi:hypothetical protein